MRRILVTNALPYANGPLHLGHMVGYVQADIWVRFQRMCGNDVIYVCADDAHGTPIMLAAEKAGVAPEAFIAEIQKGHEEDFKAFGVHFDHYHSTHSGENKELSESIYDALNSAGYIATRKIEQAFDPVREMFLPERYIKGECPNCGTADQYGDNCENCGATYSPTELKNPRSVVSGATPVLKESEHYFFELSKLQSVVQNWLDNANVHSSVKAKLAEWLNAGLKDWDISRDAPYFGFRIPGLPDGTPPKFFYVWLDAPIGYFASFKALCESGNKKAEARGLTASSFDEYLNRDSTTELWHFIGKDIINFHGLFWPAMLDGAGYRKPTGLGVNGYLTVNGAKMSKSRGTFIKARTYLDAGLNPEYLRYYFAAKLGEGVDDLDLNLKDFKARIDSDLVGKYVNIASRCAGFIEKYFDGKLATELDDESRLWWDTQINDPRKIFDAYERRSFSEVVIQSMRVADTVNRRIDEVKPWKLAVIDESMQTDSSPEGKLIQKEKNRAELHSLCTLGISGFRLLTIYLKPILPTLALEAERFLNVSPLTWDDAKTPLLGRVINPFKPLAERVELTKVDSMVEASKEDLTPQATAPPIQASNPSPPGRGAGVRDSQSRRSSNDSVAVTTPIGKKGRQA